MTRNMFSAMQLTVSLALLFWPAVVGGYSYFYSVEWFI